MPKVIMMIRPDELNESWEDLLRVVEEQRWAVLGKVEMFNMPKDGRSLRYKAEAWMSEQYDLDNAGDNPIKYILRGSKTYAYYKCARCGWESDNTTGMTDPDYAGKQHESQCARAAEIGLALGIDSYGDIYSVRIAGTPFQMETHGSYHGHDWVPYAKWEDVPPEDGYTLEEFELGRCKYRVETSWNELHIVPETGKVKRSHGQKPHLVTAYNQKLAVYKVAGNWDWRKDPLPFNIEAWKAKINWEMYVTPVCREGEHADCSRLIADTEHWCNCSCHEDKAP